MKLVKFVQMRKVT